MYENTCKRCAEGGVVTRYLGETARALWERSGEHQQDALGNGEKSHMKQHMIAEHPGDLDRVVDFFKCTVVKNMRTALNRQVREAVEISMDGSHNLLNSREEYNRCLLPTLVALGPPPISQQIRDEVPKPDLSQEEVARALERARSCMKKRTLESREEKIRESKRIKIQWLYQRDQKEPHDEKSPSSTLKEIALMSRKKDSAI